MLRDKSNVAGGWLSSLAFLVGWRMNAMTKDEDHLKLLSIFHYLQGHGRTALGNRELSLVDMGNDMAGVLKKLSHDKVDVLVYRWGRRCVPIRRSMHGIKVVRALHRLPPLSIWRLTRLKNSTHRVSSGPDSRKL